MPGGCLEPMSKILKRFLDFMSLTVRCLCRIVTSFAGIRQTGGVGGGRRV